MAYALGALSAVPFLALTPSGLAAVKEVGAANGQPELPLSNAGASRMQLLYGASILSFLGGPHWGMALSGVAASSLAGVARLAWGVTPSLLAAPLPALPEPVARAGLVASLAGCLLVDAAFTSARLLPKWYFFHLRVPLSLIAMGSLLANEPRLMGPPPPPTPTSPSAPPPADRSGPGFLGRRGVRPASREGPPPAR